MSSMLGRVKVTRGSLRIWTLLIKRGREVPKEGHADIKKETFYDLIQKVRENPEELSVLNNLKSEIYNQVKVYELLEKPVELEKHITAVHSHRPDGVTVNKNRREAVYTKLMDKHMKDMFDINKRGSNFELKYKG